MSGRVLAIGDIHGCQIALKLLLQEVQPEQEDTLIILGDIVDRGPGSKQVIEQLMELRTRCNFHFIRGNHEEMMLDAVEGGPLLQSWLRYGGREVLRSYGGESLGLIPDAHIRFLKSSIPYLETETEIYIHANLEPGVPLENQHGDWLRWSHLRGNEQPHDSGKRIICGHTSQSTGAPAVFNEWVCIDTWACGEGFLSCLDVEKNLIYQASQSGVYRGCFPLDDFR